jgi:hypothetical protein
MGLWVALFHRPAHEFWRSTPHEVWAALEAHREINTPER